MILVLDKGEEMSNSIIICMTIFIALIFVLVAFAVFAIGFLVGYKSEDNRILKRKQKAEMQESDEEKKAKKEWKKFFSCK